jgi:hypothetical protein
MVSFLGAIKGTDVVLIIAYDVDDEAEGPVA